MKLSIEKISDIFLKLGIIFVLVAVVLFIAIFYQTIKSEVTYFVKQDLNSNFFGKEDSEKSEIIPVDENFSVIIPKIQINSKVIPNVDPFNKSEYQTKLKEGIAHAKGSGFPGDQGKVFLFAHSSGNFYENNQYNSIFYLLRKLEKGDILSLFYNQNKYDYKVFETRFVESEDIGYMTQKDQEEGIILMTCWPPGTSFKRLLVFGERIN